jgi:uncharacterized membrane protein
MIKKWRKLSIYDVQSARWQDIALGGILLIAGFLRLFRYSSRPIFADEQATVSLAALDPINLWLSVAGMDPHPPFYYLLSHYWGAFTSLTVANLRLTSVFFGTIAVYGMYRAGRLLYSKHVGLLSSLLLAVSAHHIASSQYARSYALLSLFTIFSFYYFWRLRNSSQIYVLIMYVLFTVGTASIHVYGPFLILGQWVYFLISYFKLDSNIPLWRFIKSQLCVGLLFIPSFLVMIQTAILRINGTVSDITHTNTPTLWVVLRTLGTFTGGRYSFSLGAILLIALAICGLFFLYNLINSIRTNTGSEPQSKLEQRIFLLCWGIPVILVPILISHGLVNIWDGRSTSGAFLALILIASDSIYHLENDLIRISLPLLIVVASLLILPMYYSCYATGFFC